ncbi:DUF1993 domain-containing protein [Sphingomonas sp.]|uniref:DUF1993 domain-containing protein n=1 Tax=Sphingomonas sp. TaxID=28214 RepID=UPI003AFF92C4
MSFSLYDAVVPSNIQTLSALVGVLGKAEVFCSEGGRSETDLIDARLAPDMLPFGYQVKSCVVHSAGALEGASAGSFSPDKSSWPTDFAGLRQLLQQTIARLNELDHTAIDALIDRDTTFIADEFKLPFTAANFLLSFAQPNFYFHATTAYAILRVKGVQLGKRDFIGLPRVKQ